MKRVERPVQLMPNNFYYLAELKEELRTATGMKLSFNDVISMIAHKITVADMVEKLTSKADKNN